MTHTDSVHVSQRSDGAALATEEAGYIIDYLLQQTVAPRFFFTSTDETEEALLSTAIISGIVFLR